MSYRPVVDEWRKSTKCESSGCVIVGTSSTDSGHLVIHVADSKDNLILTFSKPEWDAFVAGVKNNEFDF